MNENILNDLRSKLLERASLETLPESIWKRTAALNTWGTNAIEGSTIDYDDTRMIILDRITPDGKPVADVTETLQHDRAFRNLVNRRGRDFSLVTVQELHEEVFRMVKQDAGQWRRSNVRIRGANFTPPRMEKVLAQLENLLRAYNERDIAGENVFILGAWMHFEFERIHPFSDGNGRIGRLLLNLHFIKRNWPPVHVLPMHRDDYLAGLNSAADGDMEPLTDLLKTLMGSSLLDLLDQVGTAKDELMSLKRASKASPYSTNYLALRCKQGQMPALKEKGEWRTSKRALKLYQENVGR
jgi:Fic family protein